MAAAKAGFSATTAYPLSRILGSLRKRKPRAGRRRPALLAGVWDSEAVLLLKTAAGLRPVAIFDLIRRRHPEISVGVRRTFAHGRSVSATEQRTTQAPLGGTKKSELTHIVASEVIARPLFDGLPLFKRSLAMRSDRFGAHQRRAAHHARVAGEVVGCDLVHRPAVIPHHHVARHPAVVVHETIRARPRSEFVDQRPGVGVRQAVDVHHVWRAKKQRLPAIAAMPHQRVRCVWQPCRLLRRGGRHAAALDHMREAVVADQPVDARLECRRQRFPGPLKVCEHCVAADRGYLQRAQYNAEIGHRAITAVYMPKPVYLQQFGTFVTRRQQTSVIAGVRCTIDARARDSAHCRRVLLASS